MSVRVGVIGVGMIGQDHIRRITQVLTGGSVTAVNDVDAARAGQVAAGLPGAVTHATAQDLIADANVDAVLVASWGPAHEEQVVAAIAAGKPVFCEKPLAPSSAACQRIMDAEIAAGRRLVQVGFMRRYDAGYRAMKAALEDGGIGAPLLMHCAHRNPSVPDYFTTDMIISDSAVHEIDIVRWLFGEEIVAASVLTPRRSGHAPEGLQDPLILVLEMSGGALVDDELFVSARYGYDVRGEVVCETGTVALADVSEVTVRTQNRHSGRVPVDWRDRFIRAYDTELQEWLDAVAAGHIHRPDLLGRLRRRRGHGRRPRGAPHRPAHRGFHARTSGVLRQMRIALDPYMFRRVPLADLPALVADLGYSWIELSPRDDFMPFFLHPRADQAQIAAFSRALHAAGVQVASVLPLYRWSGPDEDERQAAVRYWKRAIQITADLGVDTMNSEFNGRPEAAAASEAQFWRSMEELLPVFEREGVRLVLEPHPDDFIEDGRAAVDLIRGIDKDWVSFLYCAPHTFHQGGDIEGIMKYAGPLLTHLHIADSFDHRACSGLRYIVNPPGSAARIHQHLDIGQGEVDWDVFFRTLAEVNFDGIATVCVFAWEERARESSAHNLEQIRQYLAKHGGTVM